MTNKRPSRRQIKKWALDVHEPTQRIQGCELPTKHAKMAKSKKAKITRGKPGTKVIKYGCWSVKGAAPVTFWSSATGLEVGREWFDRQVDLSNLYFNHAIALHRKARADADAVARELSPPYAAISTKIERLTSEIDELYAEQRSRRQKARKKVECPDLMERAEELKRARKTLISQKIGLMDGLRNDDEYKTRTKAIWNERYEAQRSASKEYAKQGSFSGTRSEIDLAIAKACEKNPRDRDLKRRDPARREMVNIQIGGGGLTWDELISKAEPGTAYIENFDPACFSGTHGGNNGGRIKPGDKRRDSRRRVVLYVRVGTDGFNAKGKFIYARCQITLDQPIPADAVIQRIKVQSRWVASKRVEEVLFTLSNVQPRPCGDGVIGTDFGFRQVNGGLRVCALVDSIGAEYEIILPQAILDAKAHIETVRSEQSHLFNGIKQVMLAYVEHSEYEWLREGTKTLWAWRSPAAMVRLFRAWQRHQGDEAIFGELQAWASRNRRLYQEWSNLSDKLGRRITDFYRCEVAKLRKQYGTVGLDKIRLDEMAKSEDLPAAVKKNRTYAAVSKLKEAFQTSGMTIIKTTPQYGSRQCRWCGHINDHTAPGIMQECHGCGKEDDRDFRASANSCREACERLGVPFQNGSRSRVGKALSREKLWPVGTTLPQPSDVYVATPLGREVHEPTQRL
jgi:hypothetical protein